MSKKPLIFVADDDQNIRYTLRRYLERYGVEVKALANGFEVLLLCTYLVPDLIISDIRMPKLDGVTLLKGLKSNAETSGIPVIFMSAYPTDKIMEDAKNLGARYFLIKPFPLEYLDDIFKRAMPAMFESGAGNDKTPSPVQP